MLYVIINYCTRHAIVLVVRERGQTIREAVSSLASVLAISYYRSVHVTEELFPKTARRLWFDDI